MQSNEDRHEASKQQSTSILELMYLIRAMNKGEMSFTEGFACMSDWAREVIAEHEGEKVGEVVKERIVEAVSLHSRPS